MSDLFILELDALTVRVILSRYARNKMSRLSEKLKRAGTVVARQHAKIEERADNLIARETELEKRTEQAFAPHERMLHQTESELNDLEQQLKLLSNEKEDELNVWTAVR